MAHDVFISYASKDKPKADAACAVLESKGIRCWITPRDVLPGRPYGEAIIDAIHGCRVTVLILSSHANESLHIPKEVERAVSRGVTIVPLRIEDAQSRPQGQDLSADRNSQGTADTHSGPSLCKTGKSILKHLTE